MDKKPKPCTARTSWGAFWLDKPRPKGAPSWYRCARERGHDGPHRAIYVPPDASAPPRVCTWERMVGGARPGAGRKPGSTSSEPTVPIPVRVPVWLLEAWRERFGEGWAGELREMMRRAVGKG